MLSTVPSYIINLPTTKSKPNSQRIPGEYKMKHATAKGPMPWMLQCAVPLPDLRYMDIPINPDENTFPDMGGRHYMLAERTAENKMRTIPAKHDIANLKFLLCMKHETLNGEIWLKSAFLNAETQTVSLMTSTNCKNKLKKPIATHADGWYVGQYFMAAPLAFWRNLKDNLIN